MHRAIHPLAYLCSVLALCAYVIAASAISQKRPVRQDSTDWWSCLRLEELPPNKSSKPIKIQNHEPAKANFQIAGVTLGEDWNFASIRSTFGEATEVERGDAASGRNQMCYTSPSSRVHLIFELGEVTSSLYLFEGGPNWNGSNLCAPSQMLSATISTASGLTLGLEPQNVRDILGPPSIASPNKLVYYFEYRKKTPPETFIQLRKESPGMTDAELRQNFEYADGDVYIETRFSAGKLNYLAISKSETY